MKKYTFPFPSLVPTLPFEQQHSEFRVLGSLLSLAAEMEGVDAFLARCTVRKEHDKCVGLAARGKC
jgi:hypothetical protein